MTDLAPLTCLYFISERQSVLLVMLAMLAKTNNGGAMNLILLFVTALMNIDSWFNSTPQFSRGFLFYGLMYKVILFILTEYGYTQSPY